MRYLVLAIFLGSSSLCAAQPLQMLTEEYPPFSFREGSELRGISVDQVKAIMQAANLQYSLEMQPWARAFSLTETTPDTCVFTTGMLPERLARFKWVQPLVLDTMVLVRKTGSQIDAKTLDDAKAFSIGVHKDDSAETYARQQGFPHLDIAPSLDLSLRKLVSGRVDLMIMARTTYQNLRNQGQPIEPILNLDGTRAGIACNLDVPDTEISAMQHALDILISSGGQADIYRKYGQETN